jgi:hypothetical protein
MTRLLLPLAFLSSALANATPIQSTALACSFGAVEPIALVDTGLSAIRTPLQVTYYGGDGGRACHALLDLSLSELASRSLVPRPRELAEELVPVASAYGAKTCEIVVWVTDDLDLEADEFEDADACRRAEFSYDAGSWWAVGDEQPCWGE